MTQALEQMLVMVPSVNATQRDYATIDVFTSGYLQMDCGSCGFNGCKHDRDFFMRQQKERDFFPTTTGVGIHVPKPVSEIINYHETFKIDRYDNLYGGHSSITIDGKKKRIDYND